MGLFNKFRRYDEDEYEDEMADTSAKDTASVSLGGSNIELKVVRPESVDEIFTIADYLIDGCTVVLNTELLEPAVRYRMLDFLNGVTYTTDGDIKCVANNTYIITPNDVDVSDEG